MNRASRIIVYYNQQMHNQLPLKLYITTAFLCIIYTPTCSTFYVIIRQLHIGSLVSYTSSWVTAVEFHKIDIIKMLKYYVMFTIK
jgi:hypothetical protein